MHFRRSLFLIILASELFEQGYILSILLNFRKKGKPGTPARVSKDLNQVDGNKKDRQNNQHTDSTCADRLRGEFLIAAVVLGQYGNHA